METQPKTTSDLLVLLVGSNPLPIYVTARYLLSRVSSPEVPRPNAVLLLYSNDTRDYARAIRKMLALDPAGDIAVGEASVGDSQRDFERLHTAISEEITRLVAQRTTECSSVHLNITGGTKPMAVASYETVCSFVDGHLPVGGHTVTPRLLVSDVDPDHHRLRVYERLSGSGEAGVGVRLVAVLPEAGDLRQGISLAPEDLASLHLLTVSKPGTEKQTVGHVMDVMTFAREALQDLVSKKTSALLAWQSAVHDADSDAKRLTDHLEKPSKAKALVAVLADPASSVTLLLSHVRDACPSLAVFFSAAARDGAWIYRPGSAGDANGPGINDLVDFIEGKWLEEYVLGITCAALEKFGTKTGIAVSAHMGLVVCHGRRERELDVYGTCGYSSVLISCTTEQGAGLVKLKAFEAFQRARELGGDHAETIVVSLVPDTSPVRDDLSSFDAVQHVHILGRQDVQDELDGKGVIAYEIQRIMEG